MGEIVNRRLISLVVPVFNEEECLPELFRRLRAVFDSEQTYDFECVLIENGSTDGSAAMVERFHSEDPRFKVVQLSRNFRMDGGLTAGLAYVSGDACVLMASDLQDPPEVISDFLRLWEQGYENVYGIVTRREGVGFLRKMNSRIFYKVANALTKGVVVEGASDFRLVDKKVYEAVRTMDERNRFVRGLFSWVGFSSVGIHIARPARFAGSSKAHFFKVLDLALKGIFSHTYIPVRIITVGGVLVSTFAFILLAVFAWRAVFVGVPFDGFGTLFSVLLLGFGFLAAVIGIVGEYAALIYEEVKRRPNFLVRKTTGL